MLSHLIFLFIIFFFFSIKGRLHMKCGGFLRAKLCLNSRQFKKWMDNDNFYDFSFVNSESAILSFDGMSIISRNCPGISSRIYSIRRVVKKP